MSHPRREPADDPSAAPIEDGGFASYWRADHRPPFYPPQASDNIAQSKVLLYGPHGEALIRQEPRRAGFRPPNAEQNDA